MGVLFLSKLGGQSMKPTVKYLLNGEYHYATVKDVGDIDNLRTTVKTDLVAAINELIDGGSNSSDIKDLNDKVDQIDKELSDIKTDIGEGGLNEKQREQIRDILQGIPQVDYEKIAREVDEKLQAAKAEIAKTSEEIKKEVDAAKVEIKETSEKLVQTKDGLTQVELNVKNVELKYDEVTGELEKKVLSTDFDLLEAKVGKNELILNETAEGLQKAIKREEWDIAQDRVGLLEHKVEETADGLKRTITKEEMRAELNILDVYRPNMLKGTLNWIGWERRGGVTASILNDTYQHCTILSIAKDADTYQIKTDDLKIGTTYHASIWAKVSKGSHSRVSVTLTDGGNQHRTEILDVEGNTDISETWRRYTVSIVSPVNGQATLYFASSELTGAQDVKLFLSGAKLEGGSSATGWNVHPLDNYESVTKLSHAVEETAEGVKTVTESLRETSDGLEKNTHEIESLANSQKDTLIKIEEIDEESRRMSNKLDRTAESMLSKISREDVTEIFDGMENSSRNLLSNGNFFNGTTGWTASKEWTVVGKQGKDYIYTTRSGLSSDLEIAAFSDYISVEKDEKISFGCDMYIDDISKYDRKIPVRIELYDKQNVRVDFKNYELNDLISNPITGRNSRLGGVYLVERSDVFKARLRFSLQRNGGIGFTDVSLRVGSITDKSWMPSPEDNGVITAKLETSINQKADGVEIDSLKREVDKTNQSVTESESKWKAEADGIKSDVSKIYASKDELGIVDKKATSAQQTADGFKQQVERVETSMNEMTIGARNLILKADNFNKYDGYAGATVTREPIDMTTEWGFSNATKFKTSGGKIGLRVLFTSSNHVSEPMILNQKYTHSFYIKNTGSVPFNVNYNGIDPITSTVISPGMSKRIVQTGIRRKDYDWFQVHFTENTGANIEFIIGREQLEKGSKVTDWSLAPEDMASQDSLTESNKKISKLEQTAEGFIQEVEQVKKDTQANKTQIQQVSDRFSVNVAELKKYTLSYRDGKLLYEDPLFQEGFNGLKIYNNSNNGKVTMSIVDRNDSPTESASAVEVRATASASPGFGGISWQNKARAGAKFVYRIIAKIPVGRNLAFGSNSTGDGAVHTWLSDFKGTDKWEEYLFLVECGQTGTFSTTGFFYIKDGVVPTDANPLVWQLCFGTVIDITSFDSTTYDLKKEVEFKLTPDGIFGEISQSTEFHTWKENVDDKPSRGEFDEATEIVSNLDGLMSDPGGVLEKVANLSLESDKFRTEIGEIVSTVEDNEKVVSDVRSYMEFGKGGLEIGKTDEDGMKVTISNTTMTFYDKGTPVAFVTGQTMKITEAEILDKIKVGRHEISKLKEKPDITIIKYVG